MINTSLRIALENNPELFTFFIEKDTIFVKEDNDKPIPIAKLPIDYINISHLLKVKSWRINNNYIQIQIHDKERNTNMDLFSNQILSLLSGPKTNLQLQ